MSSIHRFHWAALLAAAASCKGSCDPTDVAVVETTVPLAQAIKELAIYQDGNGDGSFDPTERTFVVDPRPAVGKVIRFEFFCDTDRRALARMPGEEPFLEFVPFLRSLPQHEMFAPAITGVFFNDDPADRTMTGVTRVVSFELNGDMDSPLINTIDPTQVIVHLARVKELPVADACDESGFADTAQAFFMLTFDGPAPFPPPRVVAFLPDAPGVAGWGRPVTAADVGNAGGLDGALQIQDDFVLGRDDLRTRVMPHENLSASFSRPMANAIVSLQPADPEGIRFQTTSPVPLLTPFDSIQSETPIGMVPSEQYQITVLSSYSTVYAPLLTGSQEETGSFLMPNLDDALYSELRAGTNPTVGATPLEDRDLFGDSTFRLFVGPVRVRSPLHRSDVNLAAAQGGNIDIAIEYAEPTDGIVVPTIGQFDVRVTLNPPVTPTFSFPLDFGPSTSPGQTVKQGDIEAKDVELTTTTRVLVPGLFDGEITLEITACSDTLPCTAPASEFIGRDRVTFRYDSIAPSIEPGSIDVTNTHPDGRLDQLCFVADCDVEQVTVTVGGTSVTLDAGAASTTTCSGGQQQYCFNNVDLGIPGNSEQGATVTIVVEDDQGNPSDPSSTDLPLVCERPLQRFVAAGGQRIKAITRDGREAVVWTEAARLRYAEWDGTAWQASDIYTLPADDCSASPCPVQHTFGLDLDAIVSTANGRVTVCITESELTPTETEISDSGQLRLFQRRDDGTWVQVYSQGGVRPIGCSLTNYQGHVQVAWNDVDAGVVARGRHGDLLVSGDLGAVIFRDQMPFPTLPDPRPSDTAWELQILGEGDRLYFTYRTSNFAWDLAHLPGTVVAGYFDDDVPGGSVVEAVCYSGDTCGTHADSDHMLGAGPRLLVHDGEVYLAYVGVEADVGPSTGDHFLRFLSVPEPADGDALGFGTATIVFRERVPAISGDIPDPGTVIQFDYDSDGVTRQLDNENPSPPLRPSARPSLAVSGDGSEVLLAYPRGGRDVARPSVTVLHRRLADGHLRREDVDARTAPNFSRTELNVPTIAATDDSFWVAYRSYSGNRVTAFGRPAGVGLADDELGACPEYHRRIEIPIDQLELRYAKFENNSPSLILPDCFPERPELGFIAFVEGLAGTGDPERFGFQERFIDEQLIGAIIQDARPILKRQHHVCVPNGILGGDCETDDLDPLVSVNSVPSQATAPAIVVDHPAPFAEFSTSTGAEAGCPASGQIRVLGNFSCFVCPSGSTYDAVLDACVSCGSTMLHYEDEFPTVRPRFLIPAINGAVTCRACEFTPARGRMAPVLTADGLSCTSCQDGAHQVACTTDDDCQEFGPDYRCSALSWHGRANAPTTAICQRQCGSNADCARGSCIGGVCQATDTLFGSVDLHTYATGDDYACRALGCDMCWKNDYCQSDFDCPLNHECSLFDEEVTPMCVARPILSPFFIDGQLRDIISDDAAYNTIVAQLATVQQTIQNLLNTAHVPDTEVAPIPVFSDTIVDFTAEIAAVEIVYVPAAPSPDYFEFDLFEEPPFDRAQGEVQLVLTMINTEARVSSGFVFPLHDGWTIRVRFVPRVLDATSTTGGYAGLTLQYVGVQVVATTHDPILGIDIEIGSQLESTMDRNLAPFARQMVTTVLNLTGAMEGPGRPQPGGPDLTRCLFVPGDAATSAAQLPALCAGGAERVEQVRADGDVLGITLRRCP